MAEPGPRVQCSREARRLGTNAPLFDQLRFRNGAMKVASWSVHPLFSQLEPLGHRAPAQSIASTTLASLVICTKRCLSQTRSRIKWSLRDMVVDHECVVASLHFELGATSSDAHTTPPSHAQLHYSQSIDATMLHDEQCNAEFRTRLRGHKCSPDASLEKEVDDLQRASREPAVRAFGGPPLHPGYRNVRGKLSSARKRSKALSTSVASHRWTSFFSVPFSSGETLSGLQDARCRGYDQRVHFKNKAWEIQKDMAPTELHETCKKKRFGCLVLDPSVP